MIELSNIIYKDKKVASFYICSSNIYEKEFYFNIRNDNFNRDKSLFLKVVKDGGNHISWIEMPRKLFKKKQIKNDYQIYFDSIANEYSFILNKCPKILY